MTGIIGNMVLVNSGSHTWKNFFGNHLQFGHASSKCSPALFQAEKV
jgi:hypothetical protein